MQEATEVSTLGDIFEPISQIETVETICEYEEIISETEQCMTVQQSTPILLTENPIHTNESQIPTVQVNFCQKLLFLHQLTHNMTIDCSLLMKIVSLEYLQNMLCTQIVVFVLL